MSWTMSFGGQGLEEADGVTVEKVEDLPVVKMKLKEVLSEGQAIERFSRGGRRIKLTMVVRQANSTALGVALDTLTDLLSDPTGGYLSLNGTRKIWAYPKPGAIRVVSGGGNVAAELKAEFFAEEPYWLEATADTDSTSITGTGSTATSTITYSGTAPVYPTIKLNQYSTASGTRDPLNLIVANVTHGEFIRIDGAALGNKTDKIVLDATDESIYLDNDTSSNTRVPKRVSGAFIRLLPGSNLIYFDTLSSGGKMDFELSWDDRFNTPGY